MRYFYLTQKRIAMRTAFTLICLTLFASSSFAQDWELLNPPVGLQAVDKSVDEEKFYMNIVNRGTDTLQLLAYRTENVLAASADTSHLTYFCWDLCYGTSGSQSINPITILPGDTLNRPGTIDEQYVMFQPGNIDGYSRTTMRIINADDANDFLDVVFEFSVGGATNSITDAALAAKSLSNPYPNPVRNSFSVDYELPAGNATGTLRLYNLIGKEVSRQTISTREGTATMEVSAMPRGVYFLHLMADDVAISSRRVILN